MNFIFNFSCVPEKNCGNTDLTVKGVDIKYALAEESVCEEKSEVCCHEESVIEQKIHLNKDELNIRGDY